MLGATFVSTLLSFFSQLAVVSLKVLQSLLDGLCRCDVTSPKRDRIESFFTIRHQSLALIKLDDGAPNLVHLTDVPVALFVEVCEAHVVCIDLTNFLTGDVDLTAYVILSLHPVLARLIDPLNVIGLIGKGKFACELMSHASHH